MGDGKEMRIKECKEWDKLPTAIQEILLENQRLINKHLAELEDEKDRNSIEGGLSIFTSSTREISPTDSKFSKAKKKAGVRKDANIE